MPDERSAIDALLEDAEVEAGSREIAAALYRAALAEGHSEDVALDEAAGALRLLRAEWDAAKREDGAI